jgi:thiosulfate/3-mercaptopyruvate sulfurtransferase
VDGRGPLAAGDELARLLDDPAVVVADVRWYLDGRSGRAAYEAGHVPGAVFVDLDTVLAAAPETGAGRHPLPDPGTFAGALGRLGIGADAFVVAYDDAGGTIAARLWWMLRAVGQDAAVLDGGLAAWPGPLETGPGRGEGDRRTVARALVPWPDGLVADGDAVAAMSEGRAPGVLLDARARPRYAGEVEPVDPRAGHIPGARSLPAAELLDPATGRFLSPSELRARFEAYVPAADDAPPVAYCGSGVTACHTLLALEVAGIQGGRLYPGSWSAWRGRSDRPIATGNDSR